MYALITGASSGIGKQYATLLAKQYHYDLILISNQQTELEQLANTLANDYQVQTRTICCDLSTEGIAKTIYERCQAEQLEVEVLINNAGMFFWQPLIELPESKIHTMLMLHMVTLAELCRMFAPQMCQRKKGYILNMSSLTAWITIPGIQCYNSTKAFVLSFSKSLWYELKPYGVGVTVLTPGAIDTPLYGLDANTRKHLVRWGISLPPEKFAGIALKRMFAKRKKAMPGWVNHIATPIIAHLPDWLVFAAMKRFPQYKNIPL